MTRALNDALGVLLLTAAVLLAGWCWMQPEPPYNAVALSCYPTPKESPDAR